MKPTVVTGIKPSGKLHLGNYLGMVKKAIELQESEKYECFFFIADYHSMTQNYNAEEKREEIFNVVVDLLAIGINPEKATFFVQSHVPQHTDLTWILSTVTSTGRLANMIEYKEKVQEGHTPNVGLYLYPVLMAADILVYNAAYVPVGEDQRQHLELARDIARSFNARFGDLFTEPEAIHTRIPRVMSLDDPEKKMSKSLPNGCLYLSDTPEAIMEKCKRAVTDSERTIGYDPENRPGISNLLLLYSEFSGRTMEDIVTEYKDAGYATFKQALADLLIEKLEPFRKKREALLKDRTAILDMLEEHARQAKEKAQPTLVQAREKAGLI